MIVVVSGENQRRDVRRELRLLVRPEERVLLRPPALFGSCDVVRMFDDDLDNLRRALADGVQQSFLDAGEADLLHQQLNELHRFAVDSQMQGATTHVIDAVRIQRRAAIFERLADDRNVTERGGV